MRKESTIRTKLKKLKEQNAKQIKRHGKEVWWSHRPEVIKTLEWVLNESNDESSK